MCAAVVPFALGNLVLASLDFVDPGFLELDQGRKNITWWSTSSFVLHAHLSSVILCLAKIDYSMHVAVIQVSQHWQSKYMQRG